jgi:hypothetical protein
LIFISIKITGTYLLTYLLCDNTPEVICKLMEEEEEEEEEERSYPSLNNIF